MVRVVFYIMNKVEFSNALYQNHLNKNIEIHNKYKEFVSKNLSLRILDNKIENLNWGESYFGPPLGSIMNNTEKYDSIHERNESIRKNVREHLSTQNSYDKFIYVNNDTVEIATGVVIKVYNYGYAIYPDPKSTIKLNEFY